MQLDYKLGIGGSKHPRADWVALVRRLRPRRCHLRSPGPDCPAAQQLLPARRLRRPSPGAGPPPPPGRPRPAAARPARARWLGGAAGPAGPGSPQCKLGAEVLDRAERLASGAGGAGPPGLRSYVWLSPLAEALLDAVSELAPGEWPCTCAALGARLRAAADSGACWGPPRGPPVLGPPLLLAVAAALSSCHVAPAAVADGPEGASALAQALEAALSAELAVAGEAAAPMAAAVRAHLERSGCRLTHAALCALPAHPRARAAAGRELLLWGGPAQSAGMAGCSYTPPLDLACSRVGIAAAAHALEASASQRVLDLHTLQCLAAFLEVEMGMEAGRAAPAAGGLHDAAAAVAVRRTLGRVFPEPAAAAAASLAVAARAPAAVELAALAAAALAAAEELAAARQQALGVRFLPSQRPRGATLDADLPWAAAGPPPARPPESAGSEDEQQFSASGGKRRSPLEHMFITPLKLNLGGTPLTIQPTFNTKLKARDCVGPGTAANLCKCLSIEAYHIGLLEGSLRVGLATQLEISGQPRPALAPLSHGDILGANELSAQLTRWPTVGFGIVEIDEMNFERGAEGAAELDAGALHIREGVVGTAGNLVEAGGSKGDAPRAEREVHFERPAAMGRMRDASGEGHAAEASRRAAAPAVVDAHVAGPVRLPRLPLSGGLALSRLAGDPSMPPQLVKLSAGLPARIAMRAGARVSFFAHAAQPARAADQSAPAAVVCETEVREGFRLTSEFIAPQPRSDWAACLRVGDAKQQRIISWMCKFF
ncbi:unnamed protein product [Prorocentrum cordatum]|nr:unnamed protein product [Polarella glacialis]